MLSAFCAAVLWVISSVGAGNILVLSPITTKSHSNFIQPVAKALADRGHSVTYWNGLPPDWDTFSNQTARVRLLYSPALAPLHDHPEVGYDDRPFQLLLDIPSRMATYCTAVYREPVFQQLMDSTEHFHLLIIEALFNECVLPLARKFDVPFVYMVGMSPSPWLLDAVGSSLALHHLPPGHVSEHIRRLFLSTFSRLPQRILWKWEDKPGENESIPSNVKLLPWMPQQDLLGHPKIRLFITHGGLFSNQEAVYHGVPFIASPVIAQKAHDDGYAIRLDWDDLTEEVLYDAIQRILTDSRYGERMDRVSALMRDQKGPTFGPGRLLDRVRHPAPRSSSSKAGVPQTFPFPALSRRRFPFPFIYPPFPIDFGLLPLPFRPPKSPARNKSQNLDEKIQLTSTPAAINQSQRHVVTPSNISPVIVDDQIINRKRVCAVKGTHAERAIHHVDPHVESKFCGGQHPRANVLWSPMLLFILSARLR